MHWKVPGQHHQKGLATAELVWMFPDDAAAGRVTMGNGGTPQTIELVKSSYQPIKAEPGDSFEVSTPGGTILERMEDMAQALLRRVRIHWVDWFPTN